MILTWASFCRKCFGWLSQTGGYIHTPSNDVKDPGVNSRLLGLVLKNRSALWRYSFALGIGLFMVGLSDRFDWIDRGHLYSLKVAGVVVVALFSGIIPALIVAGFAAIVLEYSFIEPMRTAFDSASSLLRVLLYFFIAGVTGWLASYLKMVVNSLRLTVSERDRSIKARDDVLAVVSHDLRNPLSAISLNAMILKRHEERAGGASRKTENADAIIRSALRMEHLIQDLLDASKIEAGKFTIEKTQQNSLLIQKGLYETYSLRADKALVSLRVDSPDEGIDFYADHNQLLRAIGNLVDNAIKFSPQGASVVTTIERQGSAVIFVVQDQGHGIPKEQLPHIFEKHWQGGDKQHKGAGIGLFIAKAIIEAHGGSISVASQVGTGTTFTVTLPIEKLAGESGKQNVA
ncbi:MAG: hypothetical protein A2428_01880 [Bdellovibrionales bacterium RIFOXYC1_FULL_54_43]|nr:MAG: hypothetical protein A2428_01880 [Bdellovibrionales bacterium RIFOXYC1_FULL_54_43]OFZ81689.1 MAG: hypothetical protein A2603_12090 [Bdellovibrionales bacterium RIFOXYD1_FULL_55_31]